MTQDIQAQLADLQAEADFDAWADARCAEFEAEEDARRCLGGQNDARSCGVYREAEDRALARAYGSPW